MTNVEKVLNGETAILSVEEEQDVLAQLEIECIKNLSSTDQETFDLGLQQTKKFLEYSLVVDDNNRKQVISIVKGVLKLDRNVSRHLLSTRSWRNWADAYKHLVQ